MYLCADIVYLAINLHFTGTAGSTFSLLENNQLMKRMRYTLVCRVYCYSTIIHCSDIDYIFMHVVSVISNYDDNESSAIRAVIGY